MVQGFPVRIDYSATVVEDICALAVEGLSRLRRGGMEVGGILFGIHRGQHVQILTSRPLPCEHAYGPSFILSPQDHEDLEGVLTAARRDAALRGLEPVGWYHSHTRSEICLTEEDLELYHRHFPEPWQVAMVIRPAQFGPSRVGFFFREDDGGVRTEASYLEFSVRPRRRVAPVQPVERRPEAASAAGGGDLPVPANGVEALRVAPSPPPVPTFAQMAPPRSRTWIWWLVVLCMALAAAAYGTRDLWRPSPVETLSLRVVDLDGQLIIEWDRTAVPIRQATRATCEILDGSERKSVEMGGERLREGSITYARVSDSVDVRLRVERPRAAPLEEYIRFLGQPPPAKPTPDQAETLRQRDELRLQVERMRAELARRNAQIRLLQQRRFTPAPQN
jgi:proteasome lid subunit RPN8/RPN11